jgi:predicted Rossmann fold nucleotide-binding protein DprA/Smf involved in DNA uptake
MIGAPELLSCEPVAVLSSVQCPGDVILKTFDLAQALRDAAMPVIGGFHSPMEREVFDILLRGTQPVVHCPARRLEAIRLARAWHAALDERRLLLVSPFEAKVHRATAEHAVLRNRLVAALARAVIITHAKPGGKLHALARECAAWGKPLFCLESDANAHLLALGARLFDASMTVSDLCDCGVTAVEIRTRHPIH